MPFVCRGALNSLFLLSCKKIKCLFSVTFMHLVLMIWQGCGIFLLLLFHEIVKVLRHHYWEAVDCLKHGLIMNVRTMKVKLQGYLFMSKV